MALTSCRRGDIHLIISLAVMLLILLHGNSAWAKNPLEPPDTSSPRATLKSFLKLTDDAGRLYNDYRESPGPATQKAFSPALEKMQILFDLSELPPATQDEAGEAAVIHLWEVIARLELPPMDEIPGKPTDTTEDTKDALPVQWRIPQTSITIARVKEGPDAGEYKFSPDTVKHAHSYYELAKDLPYQRQMPTRNLLLSVQQITGWMIPVKWIEALPEWTEMLVLGQVLWKWVAELLLFGLAIGLIMAVHRFTKRKPSDGSLRSYVYRISTPLTIIVVAILLQRFIDQQINATGSAATIHSYTIEIVANLSIIWIIWLTMNRIAEVVITASPLISEKSLDANLLRLAERTIGTLLIIGLLFRFIQNLGVPVYGLVAGAGVGGVAIALAARSTLENFLGTLNLFADRPVRVGDLCSYGEDSTGLLRIGTIEEIGLRSTSIRGLDRTITTIPNAEFSNTQIINLSKRNHMLLKMKIGLRLDTTTDQLQVVLTRLREMLLAHPRITEDPARVRAIGIGKYSIDLEIHSYVNTADWNEFLAIQEDVILRIMNITDEAGTAFAYPSQTLYLGRDSGMNSEKQQIAEKQVQEWIKAQALPFPNLTNEHKKQIMDTLDYPPKGSPNGDQA